MTFVTTTRRRHRLTAVICAMVSIGAGAVIDPAAEKFWPQWRGPYATGASKTPIHPSSGARRRTFDGSVEIPGRRIARPRSCGRRQLFALTAIPAGTTIVIKHGSTYEVLARNTLDDGFDASPALAGNDIYLRGYKYLYAIGVR